MIKLLLLLALIPIQAHAFDYHNLSHDQEEVIYYHADAEGDDLNAQSLSFIPGVTIKQPSMPVNIWIADQIDNQGEVRKRLKQLDKFVGGLNLVEQSNLDTDIFVVVGTLPSNILGQARIFVNGRGEIGTVFATIDQEKLASWAGIRYKQAQINTVLHEIGHGLGLAHSEGTAFLRETTPIMNPSPQLDNTKIDFDIVKGLRFLYGDQEKMLIEDVGCDGYAIFKRKQGGKKFQFSWSFENGQLAVPLKRPKLWRYEGICR